MTRPSFQFYPGDWRKNAKLRRCSHAERGIWVECMCLLHDSDEYGVLRWPLKDLAQAIGCKPAQLQDLRDKGVVKGADVGQVCEAFVYVPRHAGRDGEPVVLLPEQQGPVWYSSRMVRDEYVRTLRATKGGEEPAPKAAPKPPIGDGSGEHPSRDARAQSSSSSSSRRSKSTARKRAIPPDFAVSDAVRVWATDRGFDRLDEHLDVFKRKCAAKGYTYADWDSAFMEAIREDWAELRAAPRRNGHNGNPAWWASEATIIAEGARVGLKARAGESIHDFKGRITVKLGEASTA